jgi:hypothetical protein
MRVLASIAAGSVAVVLAATAGYTSVAPATRHASRPTEIAPPMVRRARVTHASLTIPPETLSAVIRNTCSDCHNDQIMTGGFSLEHFNIADATKKPDVAERMITKLRAGMMPPPGIDRPTSDTLLAVAQTLEQLMDKASAGKINPGARSFQRLNRAEYERAIKDLLTIDVDASRWLPLDTKSANFDNIADVQLPSATLLDSYLDAAGDIARLAVGDANAHTTATTYKLPRLASQTDQAEGAPIGTRGGMAVQHVFPADGDYVFAVLLHAIPTGQLFGSTAPFDEQVEVSVDGVRVGTIDVDRGSSQSDPHGLEFSTKPVHVAAGEHEVAAAFIKTYEGPVNDNIAPIGHSIADTQIGSQSGITVGAHVSDLTIRGPSKVTGISETPARAKIFSCRPKTPAQERPCAEKIIANIGGEAYREPLAKDEIEKLAAFYDQGAKEGGFEVGVRTALEAILTSPHFIFRVEELPTAAKSGERVAISSIDMATRLSFFLWAAPPDSQLITLGKAGKLTDPAVLKAQTKRMLADPQADALATRFAAQWLRLPDIEKVHPDENMYPDFYLQLADDMQEETEQFFMHMVRENKSVLDLFNANYTYINERLAKQYGIEGVTGDDFRRVEYPDDRRAGLLGQASILTLTSHANRTSPVLRGKWVMEVLLGNPPPPPPPNVPDLDKTAGVKDGHELTTRERMEEHRANPVCASCHRYMDPIGLALDNFDVTGRWRIRENGVPVDTKGEMYDGTPVSSLAELKTALMSKQVSMVRTFTQNLMAYAVGRRVEWYDMPSVRKIANDAAPGGYKAQDFITGVVLSDAFRMTKVPGTVVGSR